MKKGFIISLMACTALAAVACYDDSDLQDRVDDLDARVTALEELSKTLNSNVGALQSLVTALQGNDYVTGVTPVIQDGDTLGYTITFSKSGPVTIYNGKDGSEGSTPQISVKADDNGVYYWTINGEWLTVNGDKVQAGIAAPRVRVTADGKWQVSADNGTTWTDVEGASSSTVFSEIKETDESVTFVLSDAAGTTITIPKYRELALTLDKTSVQILGGKTVTLGYTVTGGDDDTVVDAIASDTWTVTVTSTDSKSGSIAITAPAIFSDGAIWIFATDGKGRSVIKTLKITAYRNIDGTIEEVDA